MQHNAQTVWLRILTGYPGVGVACTWDSHRWVNHEISILKTYDFVPQVEHVSYCENEHNFFCESLHEHVSS